MATIYRCDRCKREDLQRTDLKELTIRQHYHSFGSNQSSMEINAIELCEKCYDIVRASLDSVIKWAKEMKKES